MSDYLITTKSGSGSGGGSDGGGQSLEDWLSDLPF